MKILGFCSCLFVVCVVVVRYFVPMDGYIPPEDIPEKPQSFTSLLSAIPSLLFAYQCHVSAVPVYASMRQKSANSWLTGEFRLMMIGSLEILSLKIISSGDNFIDSMLYCLHSHWNIWLFDFWRRCEQ